MAFFPDLLGDLQDAVDEAMAEDVEVIPTVASEYVVAPADPTIGRYILHSGIPSVDGASLGVKGTRYKAKEDASVASANAVISFSKSEFSAAKPVPKQDWLLKLIARDGDPTFRIVYPRADGGGRVHFAVEIARP
jgi:hypothetical protein